VPPAAGSGWFAGVRCNASLRVSFFLCVVVNSGDNYCRVFFLSCGGRVPVGTSDLFLFRG
jgi:hypothetical protein